MKLSDIQSTFQDYLLQGDCDFNRFIVETEKASASARMSVYANAYRMRLVEALEADYTALHTLLGDDHFHAMALSYIKAHPSYNRSIRWFGDSVAAFLKNTEPYSKKQILGEMADFEWHLTKSFDALDCDLIDIKKVERLSSEQWATVKFILSPSVHQLNLQWNVISLWKAIDAKKNPGKAKKSKNPVTWIIWRKNFDILFRSLLVDEAFVLDMFTKGESFGTICEGFGELSNQSDVIRQIASWLKTWMSEGILVDFTY